MEVQAGGESAQGRTTQGMLRSRCSKVSSCRIENKDHGKITSEVMCEWVLKPLS